MGRRIGVVVLVGLAVLAWGGRTSGAKACSCVGDTGPKRIFVGHVVEEVDPVPEDEHVSFHERTYRFSVEEASGGGEELVRVTTGESSSCGIDAPIVGGRYQVTLRADHQPDDGRPPHVGLCSGSLTPLGDVPVTPLAAHYFPPPQPPPSRPLLAPAVAVAMGLTAAGLVAVAFVGHFWRPKAPSRARLATKNDQ